LRESPSSLKRAAPNIRAKSYLQVVPGEHVIVESRTHTLPMASAMVDEVRRAGAGAQRTHENDDVSWGAVERM
jgi:hypothetical protein